MLMVLHTTKSVEVDYPPGSGDMVGRVDIKELPDSPNYRHVAAFLGNRSIYYKNLNGGLPFRPLEKRVEKTVAKAEKAVRYAARLALDLPVSTELI